MWIPGEKEEEVRSGLPCFRDGFELLALRLPLHPSQADDPTTEQSTSHGARESRGNDESFR